MEVDSYTGRGKQVSGRHGEELVDSNGGWVVYVKKKKTFTFVSNWSFRGWWVYYIQKY